MQTFSTLKALLLLAMLAPLLAACGDDTTGPDDVSYPVTMKPTSVTNKSTIRAFVREGSNWTEITSGNPEILTDAHFAESAVIETDDTECTFISDTKWESPDAPDSTFSYSRSGDKFTLITFHGNFYGTGDYQKFNMHMVAGVSTALASRISYDPSGNPINALTTGLFPLGSAEGDTIAYQTFEMVFEAE